ncbi:hypothetical protein ABDK96_02000 [Citricoccus nitrophenolicus]|uniref:Uncharacterized protein n=1 Tax=Citricoccus nitrophenolicus TaxID=863575 RepID=A0ABV0IE74_9MICC
MADEYTPTTEEVRDFVTTADAPGPWSPPDTAVEEARGAAFDRWLAAHDRAVKAEGWDEGYARAKSSHCDAWPSAAYCDVTDDNPHRADQIEGATE